MKNSICAKIKKVSLLSLTFIFMGLLAELLVQLLSSSSLVSVTISYLGFFSIFIGFIIFILTVATVMLPKVNRQLDACQH